VGNRGALVGGARCSPQNYNALTPQGFAGRQAVRGDPRDRYHKQTDTQLLKLPDQHPAVVAATPYGQSQQRLPGISRWQTLGQALRPFPQWNGIPPFLGPPWEKVVRLPADQERNNAFRTADGAGGLTWQKELTTAPNSIPLRHAFAPLINDVFNKALDKQISGFSQPRP